MSWFRVDDKWADSAKVDAISDVAARLWAICGTWASKKENRKLDGFIPRAALATITKRRWSADVLELAIQDLVETSKLGGVYAAGLWEPVDGGWKFHDWDEYKPRDSDEPSLSPSEAASIAGQASAVARKARDGSAQPVKPGKSPNGSRTVLERQNPFDDAFGRTEASNGSRTLEPPDPDPDPDPEDLNPEVGSKDLTATQRNPPPPPPSTTRVRSEIGTPNAGTQSGQGQPSEPKVEHSDTPTPKHPSAGNVAPLETRRVRATDDLMSCPIGELAKRCRENQHDAGFAPVGERPELVKFNAAWSTAVGLSTRSLGTYSDRNRPLLALLDAFAITSEADMARVAEQAARDDWCTGRKGSERDTARKRDIGCLSPTVLRRLLDAADEQRPTAINPRVAAWLAEEDARKAAER